MARYTDSVCKLCRSEGVKLFLKASRCYSTKCAIERQSGLPGQHGKDRKKLSEYALQLREKNKLRRSYGVMEKQFSNCFEQANQQKKVPTGLKLMQIMESRIDNIIYRSGLIPSRAQARQLTLHGHFTVDGKPVFASSYKLKPGQVVQVKDGSKKLVKTILEANPAAAAPPWITVDLDNLKASIVNYPAREDLDQTVKEALIVEFYSR